MTRRTNNNIENQSCYWETGTLKTKKDTEKLLPTLRTWNIEGSGTLLLLLITWTLRENMQSGNVQCQNPNMELLDHLDHLQPHTSPACMNNEIKQPGFQQGDLMLLHFLEIKHQPGCRRTADLLLVSQVLIKLLAGEENTFLFLASGGKTSSDRGIIALFQCCERKHAECWRFCSYCLFRLNRIKKWISRIIRHHFEVKQENICWWVLSIIWKK